MKSKSRVILAAVAISVILISLALFRPSLAAPSGKEEDRPKWRGPHAVKMGEDLRFNRGSMLGLRLLRRCEPATIQGTIVTYARHMLVVDTGGEQVRVVVPRLWVVDGEAMNMTEIFESGVLNPEDSVTVSALRWDVENEDLTIYGLFGYKIEKGEEVFYALLPINIEE